MPTHYEGSPEEKLALTTFIKLQRASHSFTNQLFRGGTFGPLTLSQFGAMEALYHLGPMCVGELGTKVLKSDGNMTLVVDNLEKQGYVTRARDPHDRRMVRVFLTDTGNALIENLLPEHVAAITALMAPLSAEEQAQLGALCRKLGVGVSEGVVRHDVGK